MLEVSGGIHSWFGPMWPLQYVSMQPNWFEKLKTNRNVNKKLETQHNKSKR
jgi:hypothetical protein